MRGPWRTSNQTILDPEANVVLTDDGGSGLLMACKARFTPPEYEVECDARHTVWVKRTDGTRSFGLAPWVLHQRSMNDVLNRVERKIAAPAAKQ